jgi:DNA-binding CsgD family transcriptional regulator
MRTETINRKNSKKKILQSIYLKLDANNSVDAIRIALENKLL